MQAMADFLQAILLPHAIPSRNVEMTLRDIDSIKDIAIKSPYKWIIRTAVLQSVKNLRVYERERERENETRK